MDRDVTGEKGTKPSSLENNILEIKEVLNYLVDRLKKDELGKELLPHYSTLVSVLKRSGVFVTGDMYNKNMQQTNQNFMNFASKIEDLETAVKKIRRKLWHTKKTKSKKKSGSQ